MNHHIHAADHALGQSFDDEAYDDGTLILWATRAQAEATLAVAEAVLHLAAVVQNLRRADGAEEASSPDPAADA